MLTQEAIAFSALGRLWRGIAVSFAEVVTDANTLSLIQSGLQQGLGRRITKILGVTKDVKGTFEGEFQQYVSPRLTKRFSFIFGEEQVSFKPLNLGDIQKFSEGASDTPEFARQSKSGRAGTSLNCKIEQCGGRCLRGGESCRLTPTESQRKLWSQASGKNLATKPETSLAKKRREAKEERIAIAREKEAREKAQKKAGKKTTNSATPLKDKIQEKQNQVRRKYESRLDKNKADYDQKKQALIEASKDSEPARKVVNAAEKKYYDLLKKREKELNDIAPSLTFDEVKKSYKPPQPQTKHGMPQSEDMWSVEYNGMRFHSSSEFNKNSDAISLIQQVATNEPLPRSFTKHTKDVYFSQGKNKYDSYWEKEYNSTGFVSAATGGNEGVVYYQSRNGGKGDYSTLTHEMGHNFAQSRYGQPTPSPVSDFFVATKEGDPISTYAKSSPAEDFAETAKAYFLDKEKLKQKCPERYKVFEKMLKDESYGG
jgi:hypothetical protein